MLLKGRDIMTAFSKNLKNIRESRGLTKTAVAKSIGLTLPAYNFYERGEHEPNLTNLKKIADILGVPADILLNDVNKDDEFSHCKKLWQLNGYKVEEDNTLGTIEIFFNESVEKIVVNNGNVETKKYDMLTLKNKQEFINLTYYVEKQAIKELNNIKEKILRDITENATTPNYIVEQNGVRNYYTK